MPVFKSVALVFGRDLSRQTPWSSGLGGSSRFGRRSAVLNLIWMHPAIPRLLDLQTIDQHIAALRAELDSYPKRIQEADLKLTGARNAVAAAREANTRSLTERKKFELDVQQWKERAKKYREQSGAVKTNEAYKTLQHEIANPQPQFPKPTQPHLKIMMAGEDS